MKLLLSLIALICTGFIPVYADHTPQWVIDGCEEENYDSDYCLEVLCHEDPNNMQCPPGNPQPGPELDWPWGVLQAVPEIDPCIIFPETCGIGDPIPCIGPDCPPPDRCDPPYCPYTLSELAHSGLIQVGQGIQLQKDIAALQSDIDGIKGGIVTEARSGDDMTGLVTGLISTTLIVSIIALGIGIKNMSRKP